MADDQKNDVDQIVEASTAIKTGTNSAGLQTGQTQINREFQEKAVMRRAQEFNLPYVNIGRTVLNPDFMKVITEDEAKKGRLIPFFRLGKKLRVAVEDPNNAETKKAIEKLQKAGYQIFENLASKDGIDEALKHYDQEDKYKKPDLVQKVDKSKVQTYEKEIEQLADMPQKLKNMTAEEGLNLMDIASMKTGASDIHYEPTDGEVEIRFRIDGMLHKVFMLDNSTYDKIAKQIKFQSKMQLNVNTVPQDGRYDFKFNDRKIDVRVSAIPTPYGDSLVCRYLTGDSLSLGFEDLGFQGLALKKMNHAVKLANGMVLVTGPTGSGKTTTLYSVLNQMRTPENKIITLEDPVEYKLEGVTQSQIDEKRGYDFADGLRSLLRHDPDIVMIGEIRDLETAETAAQAALTGHVLLSTLHTNSAIESIPRLVNMGLPPFMVAPALDTIVAQRLVRKVCPKCSTMEAISDSEKKEFEQVMENLKNVNPSAVIEVPSQVPHVKGCDACSNTGYEGRIVIAEVVTVDQEMKNLILDNSSSVDLITAARKGGMLTMREDGYIKVAQGITTIEEVHRVTNLSI